MIAKNILEKTGLSAEQASVYLVLLEHGLVPAKFIAQKAGIGRPLTYKILDQLVTRGLAERRSDAGKVIRFFPRHPQQLKELVHDQKIAVEQASGALQQIFGELSSSYNILLGKPNVRFLEGSTALEEVHADILEVGKPISIISSPAHRDEYLELIRKQIERQVERNIETRAITPIDTTKRQIDHTLDQRNMVTRKVVPLERLDIPAQIIIYGDKVAITNFRDHTASVIIESSYINETFSKIFEYMWKHSLE